jgi:hypothetical protein
MKRSTCRLISWSALALALGLGGVAIRAGRAKAGMERQLAIARAESERLDAEWRALQSRAAASAASASASVSAPAAASKPDQAAFPPRIRAPGLVDLARENPQLWNEFIQSKRVELGRFYLPVMQRLELTSAQRERLKDIMADELARSSDIFAAGTAQGLAFEDPALVKLRADSSVQRQRELNELLGPVGLREFEDFERATPMRGAVDGFAVQVARIAPLTSLQADQLERALAQSNAEYRKGKHADPKALDWEQADRLAETILTPPQFEIWKLGVAHNSFGGPRIQQELQLTYERAMERAKGGDARSGSR